LKLAEQRDNISVVADQVGSPTWARLIAATTTHCLAQAQTQRQSSQFNSGLFHLTSAGTTTWHGFAQAIVEVASERLEKKLKVGAIAPIPTAEYPTPAKRPMNSELATSRLEGSFGVVMPDWKQCLGLCIEELR
jgi:dTDP-4-dehydrorhamnose reductase